MKNQLIEKIRSYYDIDEKQFLELFEKEELKLSNAYCIKHFINHINSKINQDYKILIVGDYDADGITSAAILVRLFRSLNFDVKYYIPSRYDDGYGLNLEILNKAKNNFDLIIAIDNGVKSFEAIDYCKANNITLAIIDHHQYEVKPEVDFFIHQNLLEADFENFSAAGLAFIIAREFRKDPYDVILASIGLIGDMMKVFKQTRAIIKKANDYLFDHIPLQLKYLLNNTYHFDAIAFEIVPKINAISRIGITNVNEVVNYFCSDDAVYLKEYALKINEINEYRKILTDKYCDFIDFDKLSNNFIEVIYEPNFKEGLCGLLANKLSKKYQKPFLVLAKNKNVIKGSGRSYGDFNIYDYFNNQIFMDKYGGHKQAIGFSLKDDGLKALKKHIKNNYVEIKKNEEKTLLLDNEELNEELMDLIEKLQPYGEGLNHILFEIRKPTIKKFLMIKNKYPKWIIDDYFEAICFEEALINKKPEVLIGNLNSQRNRKMIKMIVKKYF